MKKKVTVIFLALTMVLALAKLELPQKVAQDIAPKPLIYIEM